MTYEEQLQTPEWKEKRHSILARDMFMCQRCMRQDGLQVHHKRYVSGKMAWEYEDRDLVTLCRKCHADEHDKPVNESRIDDRRFFEYDMSKRLNRPKEGTGLKSIKQVMGELLNKIANG